MDQPPGDPATRTVPVLSLARAVGQHGFSSMMTDALANIGAVAAKCQAPLRWAGTAAAGFARIDVQAATRPSIGSCETGIDPLVTWDACLTSTRLVPSRRCKVRHVTDSSAYVCAVESTGRAPLARGTYK